MPRKVKRPSSAPPECAEFLEFAEQAKAFAESDLATQHAVDIDFSPPERDALCALEGLSAPLLAELRKSGVCRLSLADVLLLLAAVARVCSAEPPSPDMTFPMFMALERLVLASKPPVESPQPSRKARSASALMAAFGLPGAKAPPKQARSKQGRTMQPTGALYQFKIVLRGLKPEIWRRIQVEDCTLDALHGHIQTAMGWHNSHLHDFEIHRDRFVNLRHMPDDGWGPLSNDTRETLLSDVVPPYAPKKRFVFKYVYDFGDCWTHEIRLERTPERDPAARYPRCIEGASACPPEDCGGVWGYSELLETLADPEHEQHEELLEWAGGPIDPDAFDAQAATRRMHSGIIDIL